MMEARLGIAELGLTELGYYVPFPFVVIDGVDRTTMVDPGSLRVHEVINDDPDEVEFLIPSDTGYVPTEGESVQVAIGSIDNVKFSGSIASAEFQFESDGEATPWISVRCVDRMRQFNRQLVTYDYSGYTASAAVLHMVENFTTGFTSFHVDASVTTVLDEMPFINAEPMTIIREIANRCGLGSGCKIVDDDVWFWGPGGVSGDFAPTQPDALIGGLWSLQKFRHRKDTSQWRTRVICEGGAAKTYIDIPVAADLGNLGFPFEGRTGLFNMSVDAEANFARIGSLVLSYQTAALHAGPPWLIIDADLAPGDTSFTSSSFGGAVGTGSGWLHDGAGNPFVYQVLAPGPPDLYAGIPASGYGSVPVLFPAGTKLYYADALLGVGALTPSGGVEVAVKKGQDVVVRVHVNDAAAQAAIAAIEGGDSDGVYEHVVRDDAFSYLGCVGRATAELALFKASLPFATWESFDMNAHTGVPIDVNIPNSGGLVETLLIQKMTMVFPHAAYKGSLADKVASHLPLRFCEGGLVKLAGVLG